MQPTFLPALWGSRPVVDCFGLHGLSCHFSTAWSSQHAALNDVMHRALSTCHIPSGLEPTGLDRSDGKRPDGITTVPWKSGNLLVWDATCSDTYAPSHLAQSNMAAGAVASQAEDQKFAKTPNRLIFFNERLEKKKKKILKKLYGGAHIL